MFEVSGNAEYEAIIRRAHEMRAEAIRDMVRAIGAFVFRRKSVAGVVNA